MKHLSGNARDFLKERLAGIIKKYNKYNYREPISNHFEYMWAMQDVSDEAIKKAEKYPEKNKEIYEVVMLELSCITIMLVALIAGLISNSQTENGLDPKEVFIGLIIVGLMAFFLTIFFVGIYIQRNYGTREFIEYQQIAYYLSIDYLIISELPTKKIQRDKIIKIKDISATQIAEGHLAVYLDSLQPILVYCLNPKEIKDFIEIGLAKQVKI